MDKQFYYSINVGKDHPAIIGKCFIFTGAIIGFWSVFAFLLAKGFITMSENALIALVSLFSGGTYSVSDLGIYFADFQKGSFFS